MTGSDAEILLAVRAVDQASAVLQNVERSAGALTHTLATAAGTAAGFALGKGITEAPGFLFDAAQAAADDAASTAKLQKAVENAGQSYKALQPSLSKTIDLAQDMAFTDDAARDALSLLTAQTGNAEEAQKRFGMAMDLSRGANIDVVTASKLLGKVTDENVNVLGRYGITVEKGADQAVLFGAIQEKFGGQARVFADSTAGQMEVTKIKMHELQESLGRAVIPAMALGVEGVNKLADAVGQLAPAADAAAPLLEKSVGFLGDHKEILAGIAATITVALIPAIIAWTVATWAQFLATASLAAATVIAYAPLFAIALVVGLVTVGIIELVKHWAELKAAVLDAIDYLGGLIERHKWLAVAIAVLGGPIGAIIIAIVLVRQHWDQLADTAQSAMGTAQSALGGIQDAFYWVNDAVWTVIHTVEDLIDKITSIPSPGDIFGGAKGLLGFAAGGIAPGGLAMVGERGPELMMLPGGSRVFNNADTQEILEVLRARGDGGPRTQTIYIDRVELHGDPVAGLAALGIAT